MLINIYIIYRNMERNLHSGPFFIKKRAKLNDKGQT